MILKVPLQLSRRPLQALAGWSKVSPERSPLRAEQPQLSQPFLTAEGFHNGSLPQPPFINGTVEYQGIKSLQ